MEISTSSEKGTVRGSNSADNIVVSGAENLIEGLAGTVLELLTISPRHASRRISRRRLSMASRAGSLPALSIFRAITLIEKTLLRCHGARASSFLKIKLAKRFPALAPSRNSPSVWAKIKHKTSALALSYDGARALFFYRRVLNQNRFG